MNTHTRIGHDSDSGAARGRYLSSGPRHHWEADVGATRVLFGDGRCSEVGEIVRSLGARKAMVLTDPGVVAAGHLSTVLGSLEDFSIESFTFDAVTQNPTTKLVEEAAGSGTEFEPDLLIGLGGGSALDCAKAVNFLLTNGGIIADYWGFGLASQPMLPSIGIPTTAGTGSEAQSFALISDNETGRKMACGDTAARFRKVILDPSLIESAPPRVAAAAAIDAISHAIESFVSTRRNPISRTWSVRAWELLTKALKSESEAKGDLAKAGKLLLGAHLAGAAIEQSMLGAAHACANPLTAAYGVTHGDAIAVLLPQVVRFNGPVANDDFRVLADLAGLQTPISDSAELLAGDLESINAALGLPSRLRDLGIPRTEFASLSEAAALEWTARFNPRPVSQAEMKEIYESAF